MDIRPKQNSSLTDGAFCYRTQALFVIPSRLHAPGTPDPRFCRPSSRSFRLSEPSRALSLTGHKCSSAVSHPSHDNYIHISKVTQPTARPIQCTDSDTAPL